jgi:hypothetical protein
MSDEKTSDDDAERLREELTATVDELEQRLAPSALLASAKRTVRRKPVAAIGAAVGVAGAIAGAILLGARRR